MNFPYMIIGDNGVSGVNDRLTTSQIDSYLNEVDQSKNKIIYPVVNTHKGLCGFRVGCI